MTFRLLPHEFFRGLIVEPEGRRREQVVVARGTRADTVVATLRAARRRNWDWVLLLLQEEDGETTELARWSEIAGDPPPPLRREMVPGLNPVATGEADYEDEKTADRDFGLNGW